MICSSSVTIAVVDMAAPTIFLVDDSLEEAAQLRSEPINVVVDCGKGVEEQRAAEAAGPRPEHHTHTYQLGLA